VLGGHAERAIAGEGAGIDFEGERGSAHGRGAYAKTGSGSMG